MSKKKKAGKAPKAAKAAKASKAPEATKVKKPKVWVCRGCCCGTRKKHPGVDHDALLATTKAGAKARGAKVAVTDCLGPCGQGNIVVVRDGGDICWFRKMNGPEPTARLAAHIAAGGDLRQLPPSLAKHAMPKRSGKKPKG